MAIIETLAELESFFLHAGKDFSDFYDDCLFGDLSEEYEKQYEKRYSECDKHQNTNLALIVIIRMYLERKELYKCKHCDFYKRPESIWGCSFYEENMYENWNCEHLKLRPRL